MTPSASIRPLLQLGVVGALLGIGAACDYDGSFLFAAIENVEGIIHIDCDGAPDTPVCPADRDVATQGDVGFIVPVSVQDDNLDGVPDNPEAIAESVIYAELGNTGSSQQGGATVNFIGTGRSVCVWVDPELAFWNQAVSQNPQAGAENYVYPDNLFDDGDVNLAVGKTVYYTGSNGEQIGGFNVSYTDSLGNEVPIELDECTILDADSEPNGQSGRATSEQCTVGPTDQGISYTIVLSTWSTPLDDDRLAFGVLLFDGTCQELIDQTGSGSIDREECLITGEAIVPKGTNQGPWFGYSHLSSEDRIWAGSEDFEEAYCSIGQGEILRFCRQEARNMERDKERCQWTEINNPNNRCYCGDINITPTGGAGD